MKKEHFEVLLEDINRKFDLVLDGHLGLEKRMEDIRTELKADIHHNSFMLDALNKKVDAMDARLSARIDGLESKLDAVATDLSAHRADTEAHHGMYRVKESSEEFGGGGNGDKG